MTDRPIVHLICTAHLDPIYKWSWEEGAREAVSTFRTAADLLDAFPEFIFNHNESLLYEWVEAYDPRLFGRIRALVQAGRWHISGGWYLQPDVNLPGGETLVRCIVEGRRYFAEKFGARPAAAYNFDSFGHGSGLPQLLRQSGFELYIHGRPFASLRQLPAPLYRWAGASGDSVLALRPAEVWYRTPHNVFSQEVVWAIDQARTGVRLARESGQDVVVLWGMGDHGGGPTRDDLLALRALIHEMEGADVEVRHSTPEAYLGRVQSSGHHLPVFEGEIQRVLAGCYTSAAPVKRKMRRVEAALASAERWAAIAWWRYGVSYPAGELRDAWKRVMLNAFHDVITGSLIEHALPAVHDMFGYAAEVARQITVSRQHAMLPDVPPAPGTVPLYVLNPHPYRMRAHVGGNFLRCYAAPLNPGAFCLYDDANQRVIHQERGGSPVLEGSAMQPFLGFVAEVPPMSARRYEVRFEAAAVRPARQLAVEAQDDAITVQNEWWAAVFDRAAGGLARLYDRCSGQPLLQGPVGLWAMADTGQAWGGMSRAVFNQPAGQFVPLTAAQVGEFAGEEGNLEGQAVRVIHQGPVSVTVECLTAWQWARASVRCTFYAALDHIDVQVRVYMQARQKMIKLVVPFDLPEVQVTCETPYSATARSADATEHVYGRWLRLDSEHISVGVANDGQNAFDLSAQGVLGLSLTRGAVYAAWDDQLPLDPNRAYTFMDQEPVDTRFRITAGSDAQALMPRLISLALELNQPLEHFFAYHPPPPPDGAPRQPPPFLQVEPATIILGALKKAEAEDALVVRLFEAAGQPTEARILLDGAGPKHVHFKPYEIKTWCITRQGEEAAWFPRNLLEEPPGDSPQA